MFVLRGFEIRGDHRQHLVGMVAERRDVHRAAGWRECTGERFPLCEDRLTVSHDEI